RARLGHLCMHLGGRHWGAQVVYQRNQGGRRRLDQGHLERVHVVEGIRELQPEMPAQRLRPWVQRGDHAPGDECIGRAIHAGFEKPPWNGDLPRPLIAGAEVLHDTPWPRCTILVTVTGSRIAYSIPPSSRVGTLGGRHSAQPGAHPGSGGSATVNWIPSIPAR